MARDYFIAYCDYYCRSPPELVIRIRLGGIDLIKDAVGDNAGIASDGQFDPGRDFGVFAQEGFGV